MGGDENLMQFSYFLAPTLPLICFHFIFNYAFFTKNPQQIDLNRICLYEVQVVLQKNSNDNIRVKPNYGWHQDIKMYFVPYYYVYHCIITFWLFVASI